MSDRGVRPRQLHVRSIIRPTPGEPEAREKIRGLLAGFLVALLAFEVIVAILAIRNPEFAKDDKAVGALKDILTIVLGPTVALVGAATGFYYGNK